MERMSFVACIERQDHCGYCRTYEVCSLADHQSVKIIRGMYPNSVVRTDEEWLDVKMSSRDWDWDDTDSEVHYWFNGGLRPWWEEATYENGSIGERRRFLKARGLTVDGL